MKRTKLINRVFLFAAVLLVCGFVGCKKTSEDGPISTPTYAVIPTVPVTTTQEAETVPESTQALEPEEECEPTSTPMPTKEVVTEPTSTPTPEPVVFPVEINETKFPEQLLRKKVQVADMDEDGKLSEEEAKKVSKLHLKKLADADAKDALEDEPLPEYEREDFSFDFEGIQYFTELSELTVNLLGGEAFVTGGEEEILVSTKNFNRVYECTKLKKLSLYEVDITSLDLSVFSNLKRLELNYMYNMETLNVGNHGRLSALWISECHKLKTVDLSGLKSIKTVDIVRNDGVEELRFGKMNGKLETIQLNGLERLEQVDVSDLGSLKSLNLTEVALKNLDVSKNATLEQLCAEGLNLDTLDLSNNSKISYLINAKDSFQTIILPEKNCVSMIRWTDSAVTEFPVENLNPETLTGIDIQGTAIKELDVSPYPNLVYLYYDEDMTKIKR